MKKRSNKIEAIIFDLDGTLWSTTDSCVKVLKEIKQKYNDITKDIDAEIVNKCMGLTFEEIVKEYYGYLDIEKAKKYTKEAFENNIENLLKNGGTLYPKIKSTVKELSKNYKLCIVSNCVVGYIESFLKSSNLEKYFSDYECNGNTKLEKGENIKLIMERNNIKSAVYVGDTIKDKKAADDVNIPFVYASYGFGKVDDYDYKLTEVSDLINIF